MIEKLIDNADDATLLQFAEHKSVNASEIYINRNKVFKKIFYVKKGILRSFYVNDTGEEKTIFFRWEGQTAAVPECIFDNEPARQTWQALEDCELLEIDFDLIEKIERKQFLVSKNKNGVCTKNALRGVKTSGKFCVGQARRTVSKTHNPKARNH